MSDKMFRMIMKALLLLLDKQGWNSKSSDINKAFTTYKKNVEKEICPDCGRKLKEK